MAYGSPQLMVQLRRTPNTNLTSSAHVPGSGAFRIPINDTSSGQQRPFQKQNFGEHFPKASDMNNNGGLKQSDHVASDQLLSMPDMSGISSPLLLELLNVKRFDSESQSSTLSVLEKPSTSVELHKKNSSAFHKCGQKMAQIPVTSQSSSLQKISSLSSSSLPFLKTILADEARSFTDEDIHGVIKAVLGHFKSCLTENRNVLQVDSLQKSNSFPTTNKDTERLGCAVTEQCFTTAGRAKEENDPKDRRDSSKVKGHKENLQILQEVAATSKRKEENPSIVAAIPEEYPSSTHNCSPSQTDWSNTDKDLRAGSKIVKRMDSVKKMSHCHVPRHCKTNNPNPKEDSVCDQSSPRPRMMEAGAYVPSFPCLKNPQYDDISDSDSASQVSPITTNEEQDKRHVSALSQYPVYEDITEDESPPTAAWEACSLLPELSEPSIQQHGHVQGHMENFTDDVEDEDLNDNWLVIPVIIMDITYQSGDENQDESDHLGAGGVEHEDKRRSSGPEIPLSPNPVPASSPFSPTEIESFRQANIVQCPRGDLASESGISYQNLRDSSLYQEDSNTEDSADYSDDSEHNYLTASRKLTCCSGSTSSKTDESDKEKENVKRKRSTTHRKQKKPKKDVIVIDSDTEDSNQTCRPNPIDKRIIIISSETEDDTDQNYGEDSEHETEQCSKAIASFDVSPSIKSGQVTDEKVQTQCLKKKDKTKRRISSSEDSDGDTQDKLCETSPSSKIKPPSNSNPNYVIPRYTYTHGSSTSVVLNTVKQTIQRHNKAVSSETPKETKKAPETSKAQVHRHQKRHPENDGTRRSPVPQLKQSSGSLRVHHHNNNPSAPHHPHTTTAVERVTSDWVNSFIPTRRDRKTSSETEEAAPGPSRSERLSQRKDSLTPLMKKSKLEARQMTANATSRVVQGERKRPVGEGYKWRDTAKGGAAKRGRSPPVNLEWEDDPSSSYVCYN